MIMVDGFKKIWRHKWGRRAIIVFCTVLLAAPVRCAGPYKGQVIDASSGTPMEGAVVLASWSYSVPTPAGGSTRCLDAAETLTDEKGRFKLLERWSLLCMSFIGDMHIYIYKVGYHKVQCMWKVIDEAGSCYTDMPVEFDGDRAIFLLKRVAKDRLMEEGDPPFITCGRKDGKPLSGYHKARKEYRRARGLKL